MFETLRRMIFPIIITVLVFFVAMIVLEWGLGLSRRQGFMDANAAAVINGEEVPWQTYNRLYNALYEVEAGKTEDELPEAKVREIHTQAWRQLLHDYLLLQEARKHQLTVTPDEIYAYLRYNPPPELQQMPYFQTEGQFDYQKYFTAMTDPQVGSFWTSVEPLARENVLKQKMQMLVVSVAHVSEEEVREFYLADKEKIKVGAVNVEYRRFSSPRPSTTEEEMRQYFEEHRDEYHVDERAVLHLALIEKKPEPLDWERSHGKAMAIYDSIQAGADFAEMAVRYSEDPGSAKDSGDLGWFPRGRMVDQFDKMVFAMREGQMSEPVRTDFGWHIIQLHERKEEMQRPPGKTEMEMTTTAHASHILIKTEPGRETLDRAYRRLEEFHVQAKKTGFFKAAEDLQIPIKTTAPFFYGKNIQYLGRDLNANRFAYENEVDAISDLFENNSAFFVCQVAEKTPAGPAKFEEVQQKVEIELLEYKVARMCRDTADAIYAEIEKGTDIKKAAKMFGEEYEVLDEFTRNDKPLSLGRDPQAVGAAFALNEPGRILPPVDHKQGTAILQLIERSALDLSEYNAARDSVYNQVLSIKQQELYSRWFDKLATDADVINYVERSLEEAAEL